MTRSPLLSLSETIFNKSAIKSEILFGKCTSKVEASIDYSTRVCYILGRLLDDQRPHIVPSETVVLGMGSITVWELLGFPASESEN